MKLLRLTITILAMALMITAMIGFGIGLAMTITGQPGGGITGMTISIVVFALAVAAGTRWGLNP